MTAMTSQFTPADRDAENAALSSHVVTFDARKYTALQLVMLLHPVRTEMCAMQNMIRQLLAELTRLQSALADARRAAVEATCHWHYDTKSDSWASECGVNSRCKDSVDGMRYCCECGGRVTTNLDIPAPETETFEDVILQGVSPAPEKPKEATDAE